VPDEVPDELIKVEYFYKTRGSLWLEILIALCIFEKELWSQ
jgi:hypothetical protein